MEANAPATNTLAADCEYSFIGFTPWKKLGLEKENGPWRNWFKREQPRSLNEAVSQFGGLRLVCNRAGRLSTKESE